MRPSFNQTSFTQEGGGFGGIGLDFREGRCLWTLHRSVTLESGLVALFLNGSSEVNNASGPPALAQPRPLTILTSSPLSAETTTVPYGITLALSGGHHPIPGVFGKPTSKYKSHTGP